MPAWRVMVQYSGIGGVCRDFHGVFMGFAADGLFMSRLVRHRGGAWGGVTRPDVHQSGAVTLD